MSGPKLLRNFLALSVLAAFPGMLHATDALTLTPSTVSLTCAKGAAACAASTTVAVSDAAGTDYFVVNAATVPYWLQVGLMNGLATSTPQNMVIQPSAAWVNLPVGVYTASVSIIGSAITPATIPVTLQITDAAPGLSVQPSRSVYCQLDERAALSRSQPDGVFHQHRAGSIYGDGNQHYDEPRGEQLADAVSGRQHCLWMGNDHPAGCRRGCLYAGAGRRDSGGAGHHRLRNHRASSSSTSISWWPRRQPPSLPYRPCRCPC